jgi:outer membrane protein TolC
VTGVRAIVRRALAVGVAASVVAGCTVGPNYVRPPVVTPDAYKENADWKVAQPQDDALRGAWWEIFGDPSLNELEDQVSISNQSLMAAEATYQQARALVAQARSAFFPTVTVGLGYSRARGSDTRGNSSGTNFGTRDNQAFSNFQLPLDVAWTPDFWGRVRRSVESGRASAQASAADVETARLSFQGELAQDYFQIRTLDAQQRLLENTVSAFTTALTLTQNRYASGVASRVDVVQAQAQLKRRRRSSSTWASRAPRPSTRSRCSSASRPPPSRSLPLRSTRRRRPFPSGCPRPCWSAGRTSPAPSGAWPPPMPRSASPSPPTIRR